MYEIVQRNLSTGRQGLKGFKLYLRWLQKKEQQKKYNTFRTKFSLIYYSLQTTKLFMSFNIIGKNISN